MTPAYVAKIVTVELRTVVRVGIARIADVAPAATVTLGGTVARLELVRRPTMAPPAGAAEVSVIVALAELPPMMVDGDTAIDLSEGAGAVVGLTVIVAVLVTPL